MAEPGRPGPVRRPRVLVVAFSDHRRVAMANDLGRVARAGGDALLLTDDPDAWPALHRDVTVLDVRAAETALPVTRLLAQPARNWALAAVGAGAVRLVRGPAWLAAAVGALPVLAVPAPGREAPWLARVQATRTYSDLRPWLLWRAVRRQHLARIDPATLDQVLVPSPEGWSLAWQLHQGNPRIAVRTGLDRSVLPV